MRPICKRNGKVILKQIFWVIILVQVCEFITPPMQFSLFLLPSPQGPQRPNFFLLDAAVASFHLQLQARS